MSSDRSPQSMGNDPAEEHDATWLSGIFQFLLPLVRHWKLIGSFSFLGAVAASILVLVLPETYKTSATLIVAEDSKNSTGALAKLAGGELGSLLSMNTSSSKSEIAILLQSDTLALRTIQQFRLDTAWKMDTSKPIPREEAIKVWEKAFEYQYGEEDQLEITFRHRVPLLAKQILETHIKRVDSAWTALKRDEANRKVQFIQERIDDRVRLLESRVDSLIKFQIKNKIYDPSEQIHQTVLAASGLETRISNANILRDIQTRGTSSSSAEEYSLLASVLKSKSDELLAANESQKPKKRNSILVNLSSALPLAAEFEKKTRRIQLDMVVAEGLIRQGEQLKIESLRNVSIMEMVDPPYIPSKRHSPARSATAKVLVIVAFGFGVIVSLIIEHFKSYPSDKKRLKELLRAWKKA